MLNSFLQGIRARIRERIAQRLGVPSIPSALARLRDNGFAPIQIVDVGAYHGEFARECLDIWPQSRVSCFEGQEVALGYLRQLAGRDSRITIVDALVGATDREAVELHIAETASSILLEHVNFNFPVERRRMVALDNIEELRSKPVDLLKVDVQGYELDVFIGAEEILRSTSVILAELNLLDIHREVPLMPKVISWLHDRGFVPFDICGLTRRPIDNALWQADFIFVPENSRLRSDKRWSVS